jgi:prevent-host-death family protein
MIVNIHEAKTNLSRLIEKFQAGEKIIIAKNGKPILQFAQVDGSDRAQRTLGFFGCDVDMSSFHDPIDGLEEYR